MPSFINRVRFIGYTSVCGVDELEYKDYLDHIQTQSFSQFLDQLNLGTLPPGICFVISGCYPGRVIERGKAQHVERYAGEMMT